ncbi:MAG: hypothetical protein R3236_06160, partial [Phycisphaeraceae bacterium]|nr:hypothetical protein [Phycisphaeraceae bacterium]
ADARQAMATFEKRLVKLAPQILGIGNLACSVRRPCPPRSSASSAAAAWLYAMYQCGRTIATPSYGRSTPAHHPTAGWNSEARLGRLRHKKSLPAGGLRVLYAPKGFHALIMRTLAVKPLIKRTTSPAKKNLLFF